MGVDKNSTLLYGSRQVYGSRHVMYMEDKYMDKNSTVLYGSRQTSVRPGGGVPHRASTLLRPAPFD